MSRWLKTTLMVLGGVVVLLAGVFALSLPSGSIQTSDGKHTIDIAMISVPIAEPDPLVESPDQFLGMQHAEPVFDTSEFGLDLSLVQNTSDLPALDPDEVLRAVYLGHDINSDPYYIWHSGSPDLRQLIGQILADFGSVGRLHTSYGTVSSGPALWENDRTEEIAERGETTGYIATSSEGVTFTAEWHALPPQVAVVVLYQQGEAIGWQRPISGTAAFQFHYGIDENPFGLDGEMVAFTAMGDEWERFVLFG